MNKILNNFNTIKVLGNGMFGTVSLIESDQKQYALKYEKMRETSLEIQNVMSTQFSEWREIIFSLNFANNYPDQFVKLLEYDIVDNCTYNYTDDYRNHFNYLPKHVQEKLTEKEQSTHCIRKVYNLINIVLKKFSNETTTKGEYYSIFTQLIYICYLLQSNGYTHNDMHSGNIGIKLNGSNITIEDMELNTFGCIVQLFDFGNVHHPSYLPMSTEAEDMLKYKYNIKNEILRPILKFIEFEKNTQINKLLSWDNSIEFFESWLLTEKFSQFDNPIIIDNFEVHYKNGNIEILNKVKFDLSKSTKFAKYLAYQLLFYGEFQQAYLKDLHVSTYKPIYCIDMIDYFYLLENINNLQLATHYFINKTNNL